MDHLEPARLFDIFGAGVVFSFATAVQKSFCDVKHEDIVLCIATTSTMQLH